MNLEEDRFMFVYEYEAKVNGYYIPTPAKLLRKNDISSVLNGMKIAAARVEGFNYLDIFRNDEGIFGDHVDSMKDLIVVPEKKSIRLTSRLKKHIRLEDIAVFGGCGKRLEIWNPKAREEYFSNPEIWRRYDRMLGQETWEQRKRFLRPSSK
tara:strand:- start:2453 stop:2908 length:456 start_codon:yes stop_codon:yes gene_type:complete